ncbi:STAT6 protein, partial [Crypturellus undulatus]|nr:STAT6 protein [Crypturellus undulatus]
LRLVAVLRAVLEGEKAAVLKRERHLPLSFHRRQEELKFGLGLQRLQHRIREIQALRERDGAGGECRATPWLPGAPGYPGGMCWCLGSSGANGLPLPPTAALPLALRDPQLKAEGKVPESELPALVLEAVKELEAAKQQVLKRIQIWKRQQQLAGNGAAFEENLAPLQKRCEALAELHFQLQQQVLAAGAELGAELLPRLLERLAEALGSLVKR